MNTYFIAIILLVFAYFSGSFPSGVIISKIAKDIDPRTAGSCNPGSTNVARLCGFKYGVITLVCDVLKGMIPVLIAMYFISNPLFLSLVALVAVFGHLKSIFLKFEGGKGVATCIGVLIPLVFFPLLFSAVFCILVIWRSDYVSLGSLTLAALLPLFCLLLGQFSYFPLALVMLTLIFWTHRANIQRLAKGEEKYWRKKKFETATDGIK